MLIRSSASITFKDGKSTTEIFGKLRKKNPDFQLKNFLLKKIFSAFKKKKFLLLKEKIAIIKG